MINGAVIRHTLAFVLRLTNTANGLPITDTFLECFRDGKPLRLMAKGDGNYILLDSREDFHLTIHADGFVPWETEVRYSELDSTIPLLEIPLVPEPRRFSGVPFFTLQGRIPGLTAIDAVRLGDNHCMIREFDAKKLRMTIFNPHKLEMGGVFYALVDPEKNTYEALRIEERISDQVYRVEKQLMMEFCSHFPISRMVFGTADEDGEYLLRVQDNTNDARWLVRYLVNGARLFQTVNFKSEEIPELCPRG